MTKTRAMKKVPWACIVPFTLALVACGGGGGGGSSSTTTTTTTTTSDDLSTSEARAYQVPSEISAVPVSSSSSNNPARALRTLFRSARDAKALQTLQDQNGVTVTLDDSSDYMNAVPRKYIEIRALDEAFSVIGQVMSALKQTQYWDESVLNQGPYQAMIGWDDEQMGQEIKQIQKWTIDASYDGDGANPYADNGVFTVKVWVPDDENPDEYIKALFTIYAGATTDETTGEVTDFGIWDMNVKFDDTGSEFFVATARVESGRSILKLTSQETHEVGGPGGGGSEIDFSMKAYLSRSADGSDGFGKVFIPTFDAMACGGGNGPPTNPADCISNKYMPYAFNDQYLELGIDANADNDTDDQGDSEKILDRTEQAEITHRYGVFYAETDAANDITAGDNIQKHKTFGFPVFADVTENGQTFRRFGFYGSWRGEHNLWGFQTCSETNGQFSCTNSVDSSTQLTREEWGPNGRTETTYTAQVVDSILAKRELDNANVTAVKNTPVRVFLNKHFNLVWDQANSDWKLCKGEMFFDFQQSQTRCVFTDFSATPTPMNDPNGNPMLDPFGNPIYIFPQTDLALETFDGEDILANADFANGWVNPAGGGQGTSVVYLAPGNEPQWMQASVQVAGYYQWDWSASPGQQLGGLYTPSAGDTMFFNASADVWLVLKDEGSNANDGMQLAWYAKTMTGGYDWEPEFDDTQDQPFTLPAGDHLRIDVAGSSYMVQLKPGQDGADASDYLSLVETQTTYTPDSTVASFLPPNTAYLGKPDDSDHNLRLEWDATNLVLKVADDSDTSQYTVGATHTSNEWMLVAFDANGRALDADGNPAVDSQGFPRLFSPDGNEETAVQFMYRYDDGGAQTYLLANNSPIVLSDPLALLNVPLVDVNGNDAGTRMLNFDGFMMHGLPNLHGVFQEGDFNSDYLAKLLNVKYEPGKVTRVTGGDNVSYLIKPLETSVFLDDVSEEDANGLIDEMALPNMDSAVTLDLDAAIASGMPDVDDNTMGDLPTTGGSGSAIRVMFSEGVAVTTSN